MSDLSDAMTDLVADVRGGADLKAAAAAIAPDYLLHPDLLVRKFNEAYPCGLKPPVSAERLAELDQAILDAHARQLVEEAKERRETTRHWLRSLLK